MMNRMPISESSSNCHLADLPLRQCHLPALQAELAKLQAEKIKLEEESHKLKSEKIRLEEESLRLKSEKDRMQGVIDSLQNQMAWLRKKLFGSMSEKKLPMSSSVLEPTLFDMPLPEEEQTALDAEVKKMEEQNAKTIEVKSYKREVRKPVTRKDLPVEETHIYPDGTTLGRTPGQCTCPHRHHLVATRPDKSIASWAFRFVGTHPNVLSVLSGMTYMEHLQENIETFSPRQPLLRRRTNLWP